MQQVLAVPPPLPLSLPLAILALPHLQSSGVPSSVDSAGFLLRAAVHLLDACSGPEGGTNPWQLGCRIVSARSGSLTDLLAAQRPLGKPGQAALAPIASLKDLLSILRGGILAPSNLDEPGVVLASLVLAPPDKVRLGHDCSIFRITAGGAA